MRGSFHLCAPAIGLRYSATINERSYRDKAVNNSITRLIMLASVPLLLVACSRPLSDPLQKGREFLDKGELKAAAIEFKNAVQADSASADARIALGDALERSGDLGGAELSYRKALELGGNADDLVPRIALILLDRADHAILLKDFAGRELSRPEADSELRGIVALAEIALKRKDKAESQLARVQTDSPAVSMARAQLALLANDRDGAMKEIEGAIKEGKTPWWVLRAASRLYTAGGDRDKALAAMKLAYESAGWHQAVIGEYAELLVGAGKFEEARPLRSKLGKIAPTYYRTAFVEALFRMEEGRFDEAHEAASKVLLALPDHVPALMITAKVELDRGELSSAETRLRKVLFQNPYLLEALRMNLMLELRRNNLKEAKAILDRAMGLAPQDRGLLALSAELAWSRGDRAGAVQQLTRAIQGETPPLEMLIRLAEMKLALGQRAAALQSAERAVELAGAKTAQREGVFRALLRMRFIDQARQMAKAELERRPKEPEPYLWMAAVVGSEGNEAAALEHTARALDIRADYYPALLALAGTAKTEERLVLYRDRLQKAVDGGTKDARIYADLARQMRILGKDAEAIGALLERSVAADPAAVGLREAAIRHWLSWGKNDKALALASSGESANPDNLAMKALAASVHESTGNYEQAIAKYAELKARFPDRLDWGMKHAQALVRTGKAADAIQALRKLVSQRVDEPAAYRMLAMLQAEQKQADDALITANMLADRPKLKAQGLLLRGDVHGYLGEDSKAIKAYEEAGRNGAGEEAALRKIELQGRTYGGDFALKELGDWLARHPDSIPARTLLVRYASSKGDYATAAKHLESINRLSPNNAITLNDLAWAYAKQGKPAALAVAQKANMLAPETPQILDTLAEAQSQAGLKKEAEASLRLALALAPRSSALKVRLADLLVAEGNRKEAARLLEGVDGRNLDKDLAARLESTRSKL